MTAVRDEVMAKLHRQNDPWASIEPGTPKEIQGWNSTHPWLGAAIAEKRPHVVVEIGVWKGGSVAAMARTMRDLGVNGVVIAVDTWLGSSEHWWFEDWVKDIPNLYDQFLGNISDRGLTDYVVPVRLDSLNAARLMRLHKIQAGVIHLDAGHDYRSVFGDIAEWWPVLQPGGIYLGDDYHLSGAHFPEVKIATDHFLGTVGSPPLECAAGKCRVRKSGIDEVAR